MLENKMKLSTWKTIGLASCASLMLAGVVQAQQMSESEAAAELAEMTEILNSNTTAVGEFDRKPSSEMSDMMAPATVGSDRFYHGMGCGELHPDICFGVVDYGLNNSQFVNWNHIDETLTPVGPRYYGYDIEGLDMTLDGCVWGSSGDNTDSPAPQTGFLYKVDKTAGIVEPVGDICDAETGEDFVEVDALAFDDIVYPDYPWLWGWAQDVGLFYISNPTPVGGKVQATIQCKLGSEPTSEPNKNKFNDTVVEDITFGHDRNTMYIAMDNSIFKIDPWSCEYTYVCVTQYEIEALELLPSSFVNDHDLNDEINEILVLGLHKPDGTTHNSVKALDPTVQTSPLCKFLDFEVPHSLDVEGLVHQTEVEDEVEDED